jgi:hypothetical protein
MSLLCIGLRWVMFALIFAIVASEVSCSLSGACAASEVGTANQTNDAARSAARLRALSDASWLLRRRAIQELRLESPAEQSTCTGILSLLRQGHIEGEAYDVAFTLPICARACPGQIVDFLSLAEGDSYQCAVAALGIMSGMPPELVRALRRRASAQAGPELERVIACVALAATGIERASNNIIIAKYLNAASSDVGDVIMAMLLIRSRDWIADPTVACLPNIIRSPGSTSAGGAVLAACIGARARCALPVIKEVAATIRAEHGGSGFLLYDFARAKLEGGTNWITNDLLAELGDEQVSFDHSVASGCLCFGNVLLNQEDVGRVIHFLDSKDERVVAGAVKLCWGIGLPARDAERKLLVLVKKSSNKDVRAMSALAIGTLGSVRCTKELRTALDLEEDQGIRDSIEYSIGLIDLKSEGG